MARVFTTFEYAKRGFPIRRSFENFRADKERTKKHKMEKVKTEKAYALHVEHSQWLENLKFYEDEVVILKSRISEIASKNTSSDVLKEVEHFQNQLIIQKNEIDELRHSIKDHEMYIENTVAHNPAADHKYVNDHVKERDRMETFERLFKEMKDQLNKFLSKTM
jgi:predicted nuclease with TOPRIM domain